MKKHYLIGLALLSMSLPMAAQVQAVGEPQLLLRDNGGLMAPVWSPDGSKIAASGSRYTGIVVANADGTEQRTISNSAGAGYKMCWAPDGQSIVARVNVQRGALTFHEVRNFNIAGGASQTLVEARRSSAEPAAMTAEGVYGKMVSNPATAASEIAALARFAGKTIINPALSPDGTKIAFQIPGKGMWMLNADGSGLIELGRGSHPAWMPDSRNIVYTIVEDNGNEFTASTLMSMDVVTGATAIVYSRTGMIPMTAAVSPDGTRVAFENAADASIYTLSITK